MATITEIEDLIAQLHNDGKNIREIAKTVHKNFSYVGAVLKKRFPEEYAVSNNTAPSLETQALKLFSEGKTPEQVVIMLDQRPEDVINWYKHHLHLTNMLRLMRIYEEYGDNISSLVKLHRYAKKNNMGPKEVAVAVSNLHQITEAKVELANLNRQINEKMSRLAGLELDSLPRQRVYGYYNGPGW